MLRRYPQRKIFLTVLCIVLLLLSCGAQASEENEIPVKNMVTMVDLGADKCIPCKLMAPILEKLESEYQGKAAIIFIDVWKDSEQAQQFGIRSIPTQIFFDKSGQERYRHVGFMEEKAIKKQLDLLLAI
ncbi:MAG: thioredoxin family protein [Proteobacteria bacterium]|nr:thioredoxin family protein [Pseudomonadota bacterium]MBU1058607.1 thioredoxin family protein [Pseudomonadota bacterium]